MKTKGLFRGKPTAEYIEYLKFWKEYCKDGFVYGSLVETEDNRCFICIRAMCSDKAIINNGITTMCEVIPETVGQNVGLPDMKGTDIYEGDILTNTLQALSGIPSKSIVVTDICHADKIAQFLDFYEVCDNVHNHPGLLTELQKNESVSMEISSEVKT